MPTLSNINFGGVIEAQADLSGGIQQNDNLNSSDSLFNIKTNPSPNTNPIAYKIDIKTYAGKKPNSKLLNENYYIYPKHPLFFRLNYFNNYYILFNELYGLKIYGPVHNDKKLRNKIFIVPVMVDKNYEEGLKDFTSPVSSEWLNAFENFVKNENEIINPSAKIQLKFTFAINIYGEISSLTGVFDEITINLVYSNVNEIQQGITQVMTAQTIINSEVLNP